MKVKMLLRFYFSADKLEDCLNNLIVRRAARSYAEDGVRCATELVSLIGVKEELSGLWAYLNGVLAAFSREELKALKRYALLRGGVSRLPPPERRALRRVTTKFSRHARGAARFSRSVDLLARYYCLL